MNFITKAWKYCISYFIADIIEKTNSSINPCLEVSFVNGHIVLNTKNANYSYGSLHRVFQKVFKKINIADKNLDKVLILGFGAGSVASILQDEYKKKCKILGIEKDPKVIQIAYKYFNIKHFKNLTILIEDAYDFLINDNEKFDLIVIDVYIDYKVPCNFEKKEFIEALKNSLNDRGLVVFNKLVYNKVSQTSAELLCSNFEKILGKTNIYKITDTLTNWMLVYQN